MRAEGTEGGEQLLPPADFQKTAYVTRLPRSPALLSSLLPAVVAFLLYWNLEVEVKTRVACIFNEYHVSHWRMSMTDRRRFDQTTLVWERHATNNELG